MRVTIKFIHLHQILKTFDKRANQSEIEILFKLTGQITLTGQKEKTSCKYPKIKCYFKYI